MRVKIYEVYQTYFGTITNTPGRDTIVQHVAARSLKEAKFLGINSLFLGIYEEGVGVLEEQLGPNDDWIQHDQSRSYFAKYRKGECFVVSEA